MDFNSLVNFSNFFIPLCPSFPPFYLINQLFYWPANSNIWIIHESSSIMVPPPFIGPISLPTHMSGDFSLYTEQWEDTKKFPSAVLPPEKILPFIGKTEQGTSHLNTVGLSWAKAGSQT